MSDCTIHGPGCERLHVDDRVAIVGRAEQTGTVVAVTDGGIFTVRFDNNGDELTYYESELVKLDRQGAILAVTKDILADPEWTARVVIAAILAQEQLDRSEPAFDMLWNATSFREAVS